MCRGPADGSYGAGAPGAVARISGPPVSGDQLVQQDEATVVRGRQGDGRADRPQTVGERLTGRPLRLPVRSFLVAGAEPLELVEPGKGALDYPACFAQAGAVRGTTAGDLGGYPSAPEQSPLLFEVLATVSEQVSRAVTRPSAHATNARDGIDEWQQLGDIVPVAAGQ